MKKSIFMIYVFAISLILSIFISGCSQNQLGVTETTTTSPETQHTTTTTITFGNEIDIMAAPSSVSAGSIFAVSWFIKGNTTTAVKTAIYYGKKSIPNPITVYNYDNNSKLQCIGEPCEVPGPFSDQMSIPEPGNYYFRAYAKINGVDIWSEERIIEVSSSVIPQIREFEIESDNNGLYINGTTVTSIIVNRNDNVNITFRVRDQDSYSSGFDFKGCNSSITVMPGQAKSMTFSTNANCAISVYRASLGSVEYSLSVIAI